VTALGGVNSVVAGLTIEDAAGATNSGTATVPVGANSGDLATYQQLADGALRTDMASAVHGKGASLSKLENPQGLLATAEANVEAFCEGFVEQVIVVSKTGIDSGQTLVPDAAVPTPKKLFLEECRVLNGATGWSGNSFSKITFQDSNGVAFLDVPIANLGGSAAIVSAFASGNVAHAPMINGGTAAPEEAAGELGRIGEGVRGLGALPRVVSGAGDIAEHAVGGMLGSTAETVLGRAGQAAAKQAARAVVEGGLFGAGQAESEATLQNQPLTAEKLMTSVGHSALYAGLLGGGLGGLGKLAGEGGAAVLGKLGPKLDEEAGEQAFKWLAPKNAVTREAIARAGGTDAVGRTVLDEVMRPLIEADGVAALRMDPEQKLEAIRDALDRKGAEIGEVAKAYPEAGATASKMVEPIDQAIDELSGKVGREGEVQTLQKLKSSFYRVLAGTPDLEEISQMGAQAAADAGFKSGSEAWRQFVDDYGVQAMSEHYASVDDQVIPIAKMMEQRRSLQQIAFKEAKSLYPNLRVELLRKIAGSWGDLEEKALNEASEEAGGAAGDQLKSLNKTFQRLKIAEKAADMILGRAPLPVAEL
jgi:hypothetical protein